MVTVADTVPAGAVSGSSGRRREAGSWPPGPELRATLGWARAHRLVTSGQAIWFLMGLLTSNRGRSGLGCWAWPAVLGLRWVTAAASCLAWTATHGATFYCDPDAGSPDGDGSAARPWPRLEQVLKAGLIQLCDPQGRPTNPQAAVKPGDTVLLRSGWHGVIRIRTGYNSAPITLAAEPGHRPAVGWVDIGGGRNWHLKGLLVSPSLAPAPLDRVPRTLVSLGEHGPEDSTGLVIEESFVFTELDSSRWTAQDWISRARNGIWLGRHGRGHVARNNYVLNTRFGIELCAPDCVAEGNVVVNFSADGLRATRDGQIVQYNVIKNNFVGAGDGDHNHDDGIQVFLFNVGRGTVRDMTLRGNLIIARESDDLPLANPLQGIGAFDGPLLRFSVEQNVVLVNHWHGISLYDAQDCHLHDNVCFSRWPSRARPWLMLGQKQQQARGNRVWNNWAHSFNFKADPVVIASNNVLVTEAVFRQRQAELVARIAERFGPIHPVAQQPRVQPAALGGPLGRPQR